MPRVDKYGRGSAAANGEGFVDLAPGDTFAALEEQLKRRIAEQFDNVALGISARIGSKRNACELAKHLAAGEEEEVHKFAAKNIGVLFVKGKLGISHDDKKAVDETRAKPKILRVFSPFEFAGNPLIATITIKPTEGGLRLYAIEALDIMRDERLEVHLAAKPRHFKTTRLLLSNRIAYYVGDVNRTHPKFVGRDERFTIARTVELLQNIMFPTDNQQMSSAKRQTQISFVIPVYKTPLQLLRNCLDSVLKYSQPMELICVLDSPGDPCEQVLDEYAAKEPRMRLLKNDQNRGVSYSRNRGMDAATGEYLAFVDADDVIVAEGYADGMMLSQSEHLDGCAIYGAKDQSKRFGVEYGASVIGTIHGPNALILTKAFFWAVYPHVFRRQLFKDHDIRFRVGHRFGEDFMVVVQLLCTGDRFAFLNQYAYLGVGHPESTCQAQPSPERFLHMLIAVKTVLANIVAAGVGKVVLRWYVTIIIPLVLFDSRARRFVVGENRKQYVKVLREFLVLVLNNYGGFLALPFRCVVGMVIQYPRMWFLPLMPFSCVLRILCHFGIMIKPLKKLDYE